MCQIKDSLVKRISIHLFFVCLGLLLSGLKVQGQNTQHSQIDTLNYLSKNFRKTSFDSALYYGRKALKASVTNNYLNGKLDAMINIAETFLETGLYDSSVIYFDSVYFQASKNENYDKYVFLATLGKANILNYKGEFYKSLNLFEKAEYELPKEIKDDYLAKLLNNKSSSLRKIKVRTPGGRLNVLYKKRKPKYF